MKKTFVALLAALMVLVLAGCCLSHNWEPATCVLPETCSKCGETKGEALGHTWVDADCVTPKTCSVCGETEGEALGHTWVDADCVTPKTCSVCSETEGEALGHTWEDATCLTPKTCSVCAETEDEALGHTWEDATCTAPKTCSVCGETEGEALGHTWVDADCVTPKTCSVCAETEGEALGHTWADATCTTPKTCSVCAETEGEALGHTWADATCLTPKTCTVCNETEGEAPGHAWADATCTAPKTCTVCGETEGKPAGHKAGDWQIEKAATAFAEGVRVKKCTACGVEMSRESYSLEFRFENGLFVFTPVEFITQLQSVLKSEISLSDSVDLEESDEGDVYGIINDSNGRLLAMILFSDKSGRSLSYTERNEAIVYRVRVAFVNGNIRSWENLGERAVGAALVCDAKINEGGARDIWNRILNSDPEYYTDVYQDGLAFELSNLGEDYTILDITVR